MVSIATVRRYEIISKLIELDTTDLFTSPLDYKKLGIPHYPRVIRKPMFLRAILKRVNTYQCDEGFFDDLELVFTNTIRFFSPSSRAHMMARNILPWVQNERDTFIQCLDPAYTENYGGDEEEDEEEMDISDLSETEEDEVEVVDSPSPLLPVKSSRKRVRFFDEPIVEEVEQPKLVSHPAKRFSYGALVGMGIAISKLPNERIDAFFKILRDHSIPYEETSQGAEIVLDELPHAVHQSIDKYLRRIAAVSA